MSVEIRFDEVSFRPEASDVLSAVSVTIRAGESVAFIGRSGAGKTTALRMINGLLFPTSGTVVVGGSPTVTTDLVRLRRRTGYVIQGTGLFPHRTVFDNVATVPRLLEWPEARVRGEVSAILDAVSLPSESYGLRYPAKLSGGEKQRVGIARALVGQPDILLCDEPFGALDPIVRLELQALLLELKERLDTTVVFVTHDLREALRMADRLVLFDEGKIVMESEASAFSSSREPLARKFIEAAGGGTS